MMTPTRSEVYTSTFRLKYDPDLFFNNTGKTISLLEIDMNDTKGYQTVAPNSELVATYDSNGVKTIRFRLTYTDLSVYLGHSDISFFGIKSSGVDPYDTPNEIINFPSTASHSGGTIYISYGCGHTSLQKPFIWGEGFNPVVGELDLNLTFQDAVERLLFAAPSISNQPLSEYLVEEGYDLVVIDYNDGGDYLDRNALFIEEVIRWINEEKRAAGSYEKNVYMGQSMSGMCGRYALRHMEVNSEDHEVQTYISFDSGHLGVNVPLGAQYALRHIAGMHIIGVPLSQFVAKLEDAQNLLDLPASRQMLRYHADSKFYGNSWALAPAVASLHNQYYDDQNEDLGMPQNCEILAIANGSLNGGEGTQAFNSGDIMLKIDKKSVITFLEGVGAPKIVAQLVAEDLEISTTITALEHEANYMQEIYYGSYHVKLFGATIFFSSTSRKAQNFQGIDSAPGGFVGKDPINVNTILPANPFHTFKLRTWAFTPTVSTLNYYDSPTNYTNILNPYRSFNDMDTDLSNGVHRGVENYIGMTTPTLYSTISASIDNTAHTYFNATNAPFMVYHLVGENSFDAITSLTFGDDYYFGKLELTDDTDLAISGPRRTTSVIDHSVSVNGSSILGVNAHPYIGFNPAASGPTTAVDGSFLVEIKNTCEEDDPIVVDINGAGKMRLGDANGRTGEVHVYGGHSIVVSGSAELELFPYSRLVLKEGSELVIEGTGELIMHDNAQLVIEDGATLTYLDNAEIITDGAGNTIEVEGVIDLGTNADFEIDHSGSGSSGLMIFSGTDPAFTGAGNNTVTLKGKNATDDFILIKEGVTLKIADTDIADVDIRNARTKFEADAKLQIEQPLTSNACTYLALAANGGMTVTDDAQFINSDFTDVRLVAALNIENSGMLTISSSDFVQTGAFSPYYLALLTVEGRGMNVQTSSFTQYPASNRARCIETTNLTVPSKLSTSDLTENTTEDPIIAGLVDNSDEQVTVYSCDFFNLYSGIVKTDGLLTLKCNRFYDNKYINVDAFYGCEVSMSIDYEGGYNSFTKTALDNNIQLTASEITAHKGYNFIDASGTNPTIAGTLASSCPPPLACQEWFTYNQWFTSIVSPTGSEIELYYANGPLAGYDASNPVAKPGCGYYDDPEDPEGPGDGDGFMALIEGGEELTWSATAGDSLTVDAILLAGRQSMTAYDSLGNDLTAVSYFNDLFAAGLDRNDPAVTDLLGHAKNYMKSALEQAIADGHITVLQNASSFEAHTAMYAEALNYLTDSVIDSLNYITQFYNEIDKAHLLRVIGHAEAGLELLNQVDLCGVDSTEQLVLNYWKTEFAEDVAVALLGLAALDSVIVVDTTGYLSPSGMAWNDASFGALFTSPLLIDYPACNYALRGATDESSTRLVIYPNPAVTEFTLAVPGLEFAHAEICVTGMDGKIVYTGSMTGAEAIVSVKDWSPGVYICSVTDAWKNRLTGRLVIR